MEPRYILMIRQEDSSQQDMPTLQLVNEADYSDWIRITGTFLMRREIERKSKMQAGPQKRYRITVEEITE